MRAIGLRAAADCVRWAVVEGDGGSPVLVASDKIRAPKDYDVPAALTFYREQVRCLVEEYEVTSAAMRFPEPSAQGAYKMLILPRLRGHRR